MRKSPDSLGCHGVTAKIAPERGGELGELENWRMKPISNCGLLGLLACYASNHPPRRSQPPLCPVTTSRTPPRFGTAARLGHGGHPCHRAVPMIRGNPRSSEVNRTNPRENVFAVRFCFVCPR